MPLPLEQAIEVGHSADVAVARRVARELAAALGIDLHGCDDVALVTSELASNLVRHAGGGKLLFVPLSTPSRQGLQIESIDAGPGIPCVNQALTDGYSSAGSLGNGLGAVNRLMDEFEIAPYSGQGTHIVCRKWVRSIRLSLRPCPFEVGVATRPKQGFDQNGDDFVLKQWAGNTLVGVIDGLGHGEHAHVASRTARNFVESHYEQPLTSLFHGAGLACQGTRGCVMALAVFDWERNALSFGSVGNIEARVIGSSTPVNFMVRRGIVGVNATPPHVSEHEWQVGNMLVLYSDGVSARWHWQDFPQLLGKSAPQIAQGLLRALAKPIDDATILIVKQATL